MFAILNNYLCQPGGDRLTAILFQVCTWRGIVSQARDLCKKCHKCHKFKKRSTKYGHLPPNEVDLWNIVCVDLIGPSSLKAKVRLIDGKLNLQGMTFIDLASGWFEVTEVPDTDISRLFDHVWLSQYPRPRKVLYDNGSEFKKNFQLLIKHFAVKAT